MLKLLFSSILCGLAVPGYAEGLAAGILLG